MTGDASENSTKISRHANSNYGVAEIKYVFENLTQGNYTIALFADVDNLEDLDTDLVGFITGTTAETANEFTINATDFYNNSVINTFSINVSENTYTTTTGTINIPQTGVQNITYYATGYDDSAYEDINTSGTFHTGS